MTELLQSAQAVTWTGARIVGNLPPSFTGVGTDTRTLHAGELFIALSGPRFNGSDFLSTAEPRARPRPWWRNTLPRSRRHCHA